MGAKKIMALKAKIRKQVSRLDDETALQMLQEAATAYSSSSSPDIIDQLTPTQQRRLKESIQQANKRKTISHDDVKKKSKEWLSK